jgi:hypothetical protein
MRFVNRSAHVTAKVATLLAVLVMLVMLAGCATQYYPEYAKAKAEVARAEAETNRQVLATLGRALNSPNPGTQTAAAMGLAFWMFKHQPAVLEQAQPSPIEQGIGKAIPTIPQWAALYGIFSQQANNAGSTNYVEQNVSGNSSAGVGLGAGGVNVSTSVPTITMGE